VSPKPKIERTLAIALLSLVSCVPGFSAGQQSDVRQIFQQLQAEKTSEKAEIQLIILGRDDPRARHFLALHLPAIIATDPRGTPDLTLSRTWCYAVDLAAELKIAEAAPALAEWVGLSKDPGMSLGSGELFQHPAAIALVKIGDPSVPALKSILNEGAEYQRSSAADALMEINSSKSTAVLRKYVSQGHDRKLAQDIQRSLEAIDRNR
jgi:hypothetical protein